jgi:dUTP pyrophosphatase
MNIQVKKLSEDAVIPAKANATDAGYDIVAIDDGVVSKEGFIQYRTGLSVCPDIGYHIEIFPRSSISKYDLVLANSIGLVDNGYRGEILVRFKAVLRAIAPEVNNEDYLIVPDIYNKYKKGDKIAQLVIRKTEEANFVIVDTLTESDRGTGGFGSTGT